MLYFRKESGSYALYKVILEHQSAFHKNDMEGMKRTLEQAKQVIQKNRKVIRKEVDVMNLHILKLREDKPKLKIRDNVDIDTLCSLTVPPFNPLDDLNDIHPKYDAMEDQMNLLTRFFHKQFSLPLQWLCCGSTTDMTKLILDNMTKRDLDQYNPIHTAILFRQSHVLELLLEKSPSVNLATYEGFTPLQHAVMLEHYEMTKIILTITPSEARHDAKGKLPIHIAMEQRALHLVPMLIDAYPMSAAIPSSTGRTPIHEAAWMNNELLLCELLDRVNYQAIFQPTHFDENRPSDRKIPTFAFLVGNIRSIPNEGWKRRQTPFSILLANSGEKRAIEIMEGALKNYSICMSRAVGILQLNEIQLLLESLHDLDLKERDEYGRDMLMMTIAQACREDKRECWDSYYHPLMKLILENMQTRYGKKGASKMMRNEYGMHYLHIAAEKALPWDGLKTMMKVDMDPWYEASPSTGFLPFMHVAMDNRYYVEKRLVLCTHELVDLTTVYEMIQFNPDVFQRMPQHCSTPV